MKIFGFCLAFCCLLVSVVQAETILIRENCYIDGVKIIGLENGYLVYEKEGKQHRINANAVKKTSADLPEKGVALDLTGALSMPPKEESVKDKEKEEKNGSLFHFGQSLFPKQEKKPKTENAFEQPLRAKGTFFGAYFEYDGQIKRGDELESLLVQVPAALEKYRQGNLAMTVGNILKISGGLMILIPVGQHLGKVDYPLWGVAAGGAIVLLPGALLSSTGYSQWEEAALQYNKAQSYQKKEDPTETSRLSIMPFSITWSARF